MTEDAPETAPHDPSQAFEELRREVSVTSAALVGLTAAREKMPDYSVTLGQMSRSLSAAVEGIARIEQSPAVRLTPDAMAVELIKASAAVRAEDRKLLQDARDALSRSIGHVDAIVARGEAADRQWRRVIRSAGGGALAATLLMAFLPGAIARSLPTSWHVPEWIAARTMRLDQKAAGERMIITANTDNMRTDENALQPDN